MRPEHLPGDRLPRIKSNGNSTSLGQVPMHHLCTARKSLSCGNLSNMPYAYLVMNPCKLKFVRRIRRQRGYRIEIIREYMQLPIPQSQRLLDGLMFRSHGSDNHYQLAQGTTLA
jgi:hypothetical protein